MYMKGLNFIIQSRLSSPACLGGKWFGMSLLCAGVVGIGLVIFLSLRSSPAISSVRWVPGIISHWADRHGRACNFPAYGMLAVPFLMITSTFRQQARVIGLLALLIISLEFAQRAIPTRVCDLGDVAWGWAGLVAAWVICEAFKRFRLALGSKFKPIF
jgi:glycopeptide antibiotics resistance protein